MPMIQGKAYYAKIVGKPRPGYDKTKNEWSMDVALKPEDAKDLRANGAAFYVKNKGDERGDFVTFKRPEFTRDGNPSKPIRIVDNKGQPWDGKTLIGNGSTVNVKFLYNEVQVPGGKSKQKPSLIAVQVWDLVPYEGKGGDDEDFPVAEGGEEAWDSTED